MKSIIRQKLANSKRRSMRRLDKTDLRGCSRPMMTARNIHYYEIGEGRRGLGVGGFGAPVSHLAGSGSRHEREDASECQSMPRPRRAVSPLSLVVCAGAQCNPTHWPVGRQELAGRTGGRGGRRARWHFGIRGHC